MWPQIMTIVDIQESAHLHIAEINVDFVGIWLLGSKKKLLWVQNRKTWLRRKVNMEVCV